MDSSPFEYVEVSPNLGHRIAGEIERGSSVVVLGYLNSGKTRLRNRVYELLKARGVGPLVRISFRQESLITRPSEVDRLLRQSVAQAWPQSLIEFSEAYDQERILAPLMELREVVDRPVVLLACDVDSMSHAMTREFLKEVRSRVSDG